MRAGRPWSLPLVPVYRAAFAIHQAWLNASRLRDFRPSIPLVVVGALRVGGSGKTSVTWELARLAVTRGWKVAILVYRLGGGRGAGTVEVTDTAHWRSCSDEAVMLRRFSGARVFATRDRGAAWEHLHRVGVEEGKPFDLALSDDGFQDPRLDAAFRIVLTGPGEKPGLGDLLPAGPYRETWKARLRADLILSGPYSEEGARIPPEECDGASGLRFHRTLLFPAGMDRGRKWIAVCGLGDNLRFADDLRREGLRLAALSEVRDHAAVAPGRLRALAARFPGAGFLCTRKDFIKLDPEVVSRFDMKVVDQTVSLDARVMEAVDAYRTRFAAGMAGIGGGK